MPGRNTSVAYIIHDDRPDAWPGIALAVASITRFHPEADLIISFPGSADLVGKLALPRDRLIHRNLRHVQATSFNLKPAAMMKVLAEGYDSVIWFDSDIIWHRPMETRLEALPETVFVATEETAMAHNQGSLRRTENWGLTRRTGTTANRQFGHRPRDVSTYSFIDRLGPPFGASDISQRAIAGMVYASAAYARRSGCPDGPAWFQSFFGCASASVAARARYCAMFRAGRVHRRGTRRQPFSRRTCPGPRDGAQTLGTAKAARTGIFCAPCDNLPAAGC
jgi:hypothetical protein